jgi:muramidase (phage lysozyme)
MPTNTTNASAKEDYTDRLRQLTDAELQAEWADYRGRYDPLRTELAQRRIATRDLRTRKLSHLIGNARMREVVAKLKREMEKRSA